MEEISQARKKPPEHVNMTNDDFDQEEIDDMREFFDKEFWPKLKKDLKEAVESQEEVELVS